MTAARTDKKNMVTTNRKTISDVLDKMKGQIALCLPKHITAERMVRIGLTELSKTPKLQECDPKSFIASIMMASQLGLEPGVMGSCYLIPFFNNKTGLTECTFMPGYRGFIDLARRSGQITSLVARAVYENDEFSYEFGLKENIIHNPCMDNRGKLIAVYSVALLKDGGHQFDVMSKAEVDLVRETSKSKNSGPWQTHYEEMAKKTVLRRLFKWLPCSVEMQKTVSLDELQEAGIQDIKAAASEEFDIDFVIDGECSESPKEERLMNRINDAKNGNKETGETATKDELEEIHALRSVKVFDAQRTKEALEHYKVETFSQLTSVQAKDFINVLNKCADKE
jgi:recombination protein RecT